MYEIEPDAMVHHELVFVTVNYRLGPFGKFTTRPTPSNNVHVFKKKHRSEAAISFYKIGFLNLRSDSCKGNAGLKDQVLALKWIKHNIKQFNGDPDNVTIAGWSAGATCVNLHLISPQSKGTRN